MDYDDKYYERMREINLQAQNSFTVILNKYLLTGVNGKTMFLPDGTYGVADGVAIVDTSEFTADDWQLINTASDEERASVASEIWKAKH